MEDYPEELRTPPLSLVSIVGCPELHPSISAALSSQQPPMNLLALPDFSKASILARTAKARDPLAPPQPPAGILKKDWLLKHRTRVPAAVAAMFRADQVSGDPAQWLQACSDLENLKSVIQGSSTKLVVILVQAQAGDELSEDVTIALRKRAEIDSKHLVVLVERDEAEWTKSLNKLTSVFTELCTTYYKDEGRRIKARIEKRNFSSVELSIRYCFKVAVYAEFRRDWPEALKFYEEGIRVLREMIGTSTRLPPTQRLVEVKAVAEQFHFKISTILLHGGKVVEAIAWFRKHIRSYERVVGSPEVAFLHWEWFSKQFLVFGELIETTSATVPDTLSPRFGTADNALTEWEFQPAYYYQLAANYLREKRYAIECSSSSENLTEGVNGLPESVMPSVYVGQYVRLFEQGDTVAVLPLSDTEYTSYALSEAERFQDSYEIIALFRKAYESFQSLGATRMASACSGGMAIEYYAAGDFSNAKQLFDGVAGLYRQEGWTTLLWENLGYLRECARKLNSLKDFISYSLEMAALPLFSGSGQGNSENKSKNGPAGSPTISSRESIHQEVVNILEGKHTSEISDDGFNVHLMEESTQLDIDQISPLRIVLVASVAFHDQSVKPGSPMLVSVSLQSHLPCPVMLDKLEVQFNQSDCNFVIDSEQEDYSTTNPHVHDEAVQTTSLTLFTDKWMRLTHEVKPGQSGKLECLVVKATISKRLVVCCQAESPVSMEEFPLWKFEDQVEALPMKDNVLAFSGQKLIQVEEPDAQVDLVLDSTGPALVGELFTVPVTIVSKGHVVHSGELKINLVDAKGGGLLMSPREAEESESHHVELLGVSAETMENGSKEEVDNIRKIQHSFGVVSVPTLCAGDSWSCKLEIKWHQAKSVMIYVSLGYSLDSTEETAVHRLNVHRSLQIEGKIPMIVGHQFLRPFRREPLLLSRIRSSSDDDKKSSLALNESNMLIVSARNCTEVPLRLHTMTIEPSDDGKQLCSVQQISGISNKYAVIAPSEEYKGIFSVNPRTINSNFCLGEICLSWSRDILVESQDNRVIMKERLPEVQIEEPPLVVTMECPPYAILGIPFTFHVKVYNSTSLLQEIKYSLVDSQNFVFSGAHNHAASILPKTEHIISHKLVPLGSGSQQLPRITVTSVRYSAASSPSTSAATVFVYPSEPKFNLEKGYSATDACVS